MHLDKRTLIVCLYADWTQIGCRAMTINSLSYAEHRQMRTLRDLKYRQGHSRLKEVKSFGSDELIISFIPGQLTWLPRCLCGVPMQPGTRANLA